MDELDPLPSFTLCTTAGCPLSTSCRRHEASGAMRAPGQPADAWHWRRSSVSERVICNGFEATTAVERTAGAA